MMNDVSIDNSDFNLSPTSEPEQKSKRQMRKEQEAEMALLATSTPNITNLKLYLENILSNPNCEEILSTIVEELLKKEQMALNEQSKQEVQREKKLLGYIMSTLVTYGDQYNMILSLSSKLGYRRI